MSEKKKTGEERGERKRREDKIGKIKPRGVIRTKGTDKKERGKEKEGKKNKTRKDRKREKR